jgi:hypothetical protein
LKLLEERSRRSSPICQIITFHQYLRGNSPDSSPWFGRGWKFARANRLLRFAFRGRLDASRSASETPEKRPNKSVKTRCGGRYGATRSTLPGSPLDRNDGSALGSTSPAPNPPLEVEHLGTRTDPDPQEGRPSEQRHLIAGTAIDLHEITLSEILDPRRIEGKHGCASVPGMFQESA